MARVVNDRKLPTSISHHHSFSDISMAKIIAYPPGCYGTWVHWVLGHLSGSINEPGLPFSSNGDAHWDGGKLHLSNVDQFRDNIFDLPSDSMYRIHPFSKNSKLATDNIQWITETLGKTVYLYAGIESTIWILNARADKVFNMHHPFEYYFSKKFLNNSTGSEDLEFMYQNHTEMLARWPREFDDQDTLERWIIREYLSMIMYDALCESMTIDQNEEIMKLDLLAVDVVDLRDDFPETIRKIAKYLDMDVDLDEKILSDLYAKWQVTQPHFFKDKLIHDIVESTVNDLPMSWSNLTLVDEVMIQHLLRKRKFEIKCHGLNTFPTNTKQLRDMMYVAQ